MATESRKESVLYLRSQEATAGTEDNFDFFETSSVVMTKPKSNYMMESDLGKLGQGEFGTRSETQAVYSSFSIKCSRLSEVAYFMSFFLGKADSMIATDDPNNIFSHKLEHYPITSRTMPTFTALYADGSTTWSMRHCIITDFSMTLASGGTGVVDCTFNGICNLHYSNAGTLTVNTVTNAWSSGAYTSIVRAEPLINYKCTNVYIGSALEATPLVHTNISYTSSDLANSQTLTPFINSITVTGNNGISGENAMRAGGCGVLNNQERGDYAFTVEMALRKDDATPTTTFDAIVLADTQYALELQYSGKGIKSGLRYGMNLFFPVVQFSDVTEDDESPINQTIPGVVYQDSTDLAFAAYFQNKVGLRLNGAHSATNESSSSESASMSSSSS